MSAAPADDIARDGRPVLRWMMAGVAALALHGAGLLALTGDGAMPAAHVAPPAAILIDLPPEPALPPLESAEQVKVEAAEAEAVPEEAVAPAVPEEAVAPEVPETVPEPVTETVTETVPETVTETVTETVPETVTETVTTEVGTEAPERVEDVAADEPAESAPPEDAAEVEAPADAVDSSLPETAPPSEVALAAPAEIVPEEVVAQAVTPVVKAKPEKPKPAKPRPEKPKPVQTLKTAAPSEAQAAGAGAGAAREEALAAYRSAIRRAILRGRRSSDAGGRTGQVVVTLVIGRSGAIERLATGEGPLAAAAERLLRRVGAFPPVPENLAAPFSVAVPISFTEG